MSIEEDAFRYAVKNAFEYSGKAEIGALIGKLKALYPDKDVPDLMPAATEAIKKVNGMSNKEIEAEFKGYSSGYELKPKPEREGLPELDWAEKEKVITRFAPNPNGPFHLGNARAAYLSYAYSEMYDGEFILRFEDTDPKVKRPIENAEEIFREDLEWLGIKIGKIFYASDRLEIYYEYMRKLLEQGNAYVCKCESEKWRELTKAKKECPHRELKSAEQLQEFEKMLSNETKEGEAVLRIKTDLKHKDPSVRDWWVCRVVDNPNHPRVGDKYHVWPSYMFQSGIDDHEMGITFILRGQEHSQSKDKQEFLYKYFDWVYPHSVHFGRLKIGEMVLSTSKIKEGIENKTYEDWDDIRVGTIRALRRRGFKAEALQKIIIDSGLTTSDANISIEKLGSYNKALILEESKRTTFLMDPIKLDVPMQEDMEIRKNGTTVKLGKGLHEFFISKSVLGKEGEVFRLRDVYNVRILKKSDLVIEGEFAGKNPDGKKVVPWIQEMADLELLLPNGAREIGAIEKQNLGVGDRLYLEKKGYCIVDSVDGKRPIAWFTNE